MDSASGLFISQQGRAAVTDMEDDEAAARAGVLLKARSGL
jgi:hypothetical protein